MKRAVITGLLALLFFLLQSTLANYIEIAGISPNLLIILIVSVAFFSGKTAGMLTGFFCGLLVDLFFSDILGFYSMVYMLTGYVCGIFQKKVLEFDYKLPLLLIGAADLTTSMIVYWCLFLMRRRFNAGYYLVHITLPEIVYTVFIAVILYRILYAIHQRLILEERRRDGYFV